MPRWGGQRDFWQPRRAHPMQVLTIRVNWSPRRSGIVCFLAGGQSYWQLSRRGGYIVVAKSRKEGNIWTQAIQIVQANWKHKQKKNEPQAKVAQVRRHDIRPPSNHEPESSQLLLTHAHGCTFRVTARGSAQQPAIDRGRLVAHQVSAQL